MLQFHCVVLFEQSCGSSMGQGQGQKASVERHIAACHLEDIVSLHSKMLGDNELFPSATSLAICFMTCFASVPSEWFKLDSLGLE